MAYIQTVNRIIKVNESYDEVAEMLSAQKQLLVLTENLSFFGEMTGKIHKSFRKLIVNSRHIIELYPDNPQD